MSSERQDVRQDVYRKGATCRDCKFCGYVCAMRRARCEKDPDHHEWTSVNHAQWCEDFRHRHEHEEVKAR